MNDILYKFVKYENIYLNQYESAGVRYRQQSLYIAMQSNDYGSIRKGQQDKTYAPIRDPFVKRKDVRFQ